MSASLRFALAARLRRVSDPGRDAFRLLALAGRPLPTSSLEAETEELRTAGLVNDEAGAVSVRHQLLAELALEELGADTQRALHLRLAEMVEEPGEVARHLALGGQTEQAGALALRAAEEASSPAERAAHLALAADCAPPGAETQLRVRAARALELAHDWGGLVRVLDSIETDDPDIRAWVCLLRARGAWAGGDVTTLRRSIAEGLELIGASSSDVAIRLRVEQTRIPLFVDGDVDTALRSARAALRIAQERGVAIARARYFLGTALMVADDRDAESQLEESIREARAEGDLQTELLSLNNLLSFHESGGSPTRGRALARDALEQVHALGLAEWERSLHVTISGYDLHAGNYEAVLETGDRLLPQPLEPRARRWLAEQVCHALIDLGRVQEAERRLDELAVDIEDDYRAKSAVTILRAEAALASGRFRRAELLADEFLHGIQESDPNGTFGLVTRAWARFEQGLDPGTTIPAQPLPMLRGAPAETAALAAMHGGRYVEAVGAFDDAATDWAAYHRRGELRCRWGAAEATARHGDRGDAVRRLVTIEEIAVAGGLVPLLARVRRSLRACGVRRSAPRAPAAGSRITGREREVLGLVGEGLTNGEIAMRLGVSRHTVVAQIASASLKLGAASRSHAASLLLATDSHG